MPLRSERRQLRPRTSCVLLTALLILTATACDRPAPTEVEHDQPRGEEGAGPRPTGMSAPPPIIGATGSSPQAGEPSATAPGMAAGRTVAAAASPATTPMLAWQNTDGSRSIWHMNGTIWEGSFSTLPTVSPEWRIVAAADFSGNGSADLVWQNAAQGMSSIWLMDGDSWTGDFVLLPSVPAVWQIAAAADMTGDGKPDLIWQNVEDGQRSIWVMNGTSWSGSFASLPTIPPSWRIRAAADFNADGHADLLWQNIETGAVSIWLMNGTTWDGAYAELITVPPVWQIAGAGDFNGDGSPDIVWQHTTQGDRAIWLMNGTVWNGDFAALPQVPPSWDIGAVLPRAATTPVDPCQDVTVYQLGTPHEGFITQDDCLIRNLRRDLFTFTVSEAGTWRFNIDTEGFTPGLQIYRDGHFIGAPASGPGSFQGVYALAPGTYTAEVFSRNEPMMGHYYLSSQPSAAAGCLTVFAVPTITVAGAWDEGDCPSPVTGTNYYDHFVIFVAAGQRYNFELDASTAAGIELRAAGELIQHQSASSGRVAVSYVAPAAGYLSISVFPTVAQEFAHGTYSLAMTTGGDPCSLPTAHLSTPGWTNGRLVEDDCMIFNGEAPADNIMLTVDAEKTIRFTLTGTQYFAANIHDEAGNRVALAGIPAGASTTVFHALLPAGTYRLETFVNWIYSVPGDDYSISVQEVPSDGTGCGVFAVRVGVTTAQRFDTSDCISPITEQHYIDRFSVWLVAGQPYTVSTTAEMHMRAEIWNRTTMLAHAEGPSGATFTFTPSTSGFYTVVTAATGSPFATGPYTLSIQTSTSCTECDPSRLDPAISDAILRVLPHFTDQGVANALQDRLTAISAAMHAGDGAQARAALAEAQHLLTQPYEPYADPANAGSVQRVLDELAIQFGGTGSANVVVNAARPTAGDHPAEPSSNGMLVQIPDFDHRLVRGSSPDTPADLRVPRFGGGGTANGAAGQLRL
jgi:hypothetical protein